MSDTFDPIGYTDDHLLRARAFITERGWREDTHDGELAALIAQVERDAARHAPGANNPPSPIDPERLIDVAALPGLLAANYGPLLARKPELDAEAQRWRDAHLVRPPEGHTGPWPTQYAIADDADNGRASDHYKMVQSYTGPSGEVEEVRKAVKRAPFDACKAIDDFFGGLRVSLNNHLATIDGAQKAFLARKATAERMERERLARLRQQEADEALARAKVAPESWEEEAIGDALQAEETANVAKAAAAAPMTDLVRATSDYGVTTTVKRAWKWRLDGDEGFMALVRAVAEGKADAGLLTTNDVVINARVRAKSNPLRKCAGLIIEEDFGVARSAR